MAHTFINYCDYCRRRVEFLYIDSTTGAELCLDCFKDATEDAELDGEYGDFEYDDDD